MQASVNRKISEVAVVWIKVKASDRTGLSVRARISKQRKIAVMHQTRINNNDSTLWCVKYRRQTYSKLSTESMSE